MPKARIEVGTEVSSTDRQILTDGLSAFNRLHVPSDDHSPLCVFARSENGETIGGLLGETFWRWLHIELLWISEDHRGQGLGTQLLMAAEDEAIDRDCTGAFVNTMDFQAPEFYLKLGYSEAGQIPDLPPGHHRVHLQKRFDILCPLSADG
ncbi:MAG: GNAT family N-acetyltransferase [Gemmatimonadetes bacterium]|jgi:GNAT superfamily N-acetyltransferase|nr:GNAT family N-acetyltransferase [Gemmatimonadota bacterium]